MKRTAPPSQAEKVSFESFAGTPQGQHLSTKLKTQENEIRKMATIDK